MASLIAALTVLATISPPAYLAENYSLVCQTELSVGINWQSGHYVQSTFKPSTYLLTVGDRGLCKHKVGLTIDIDTIKMRDVCVNLREIGTDLFPIDTHHCNETYTFESGRWKSALQCSNSLFLAASPSGRFHHAYMHFDLGDGGPKNYKDSQYIEEGKCSMT